MRPVIFEGEAFKQFVQWSSTDRKVFKKINDLITDIDRNPFKGIGKNLLNIKAIGREESMKNIELFIK